VANFRPGGGAEKCQSGGGKGEGERGELRAEREKCGREKWSSVEENKTTMIDLIANFSPFAPAADCVRRAPAQSCTCASEAALYTMRQK